MGRKRVSRAKTREPISISLPKSLIIDFDRTLGKRTRSRAIEGLIRRSLTGSQSSILKHNYKCAECGFTWATMRQENEAFLYCLNRYSHCTSAKVEYLGFIDQEEE